MSKTRDATRFARLTNEQLLWLRQQSYLDEVVDVHDLAGDQFRCQEYPVLNAQGYARELEFHKRLELDDANWDFDRRCRFNVGGLVLAMAGKFANHPLDEVSHLCDSRACVRLEHLCWERHKYQLSRQGCAGYVSCDCCHRLTSACRHEPKCLKMRFPYLFLWNGGVLEVATNLRTNKL